MVFRVVYQKHILSNYGYKLVCVNDKFSKSFKRYSGKEAMNNFIISMTEESKYCSDVKKHFNKELAMMKEDNEKFETLINVGSVLMIILILIRDHCCITGKNRGSSHRDCNIILRLNHKVPVAFHNLKNYGSHLIMQELGKFDPKIINVIPN